MIVCSCNVVSDKDVQSAIDEILSLPCSKTKKVTSGKVLRILGKKYDCFGCQTSFEKLVAKIEEDIRGICLESVV